MEPTGFEWFYKNLYDPKLRQALFSGFFTLTSFLFSVKTFIVVKMNEGVYGQEPYRLSVIRNSTAVGADRAQSIGRTLYGPLRKLSNRLSVLIYCTLGTSILQFTLGLWDNLWAVGICCFVSIVSSVLLARVLWISRKNFKYWIDALESDFCEKVPTLDGKIKAAADEFVKNNHPALSPADNSPTKGDVDPR